MSHLRSLIRRAVELSPETSLQYRATIYTGLKRFDEAIADTTRYIETSKRYAGRNSKSLAFEYARRAHMQTAAGRYDEAIADFETALRLDPDRKEAVEKLIANVRAKQAQSPN